MASAFTSMPSVGSLATPTDIRTPSAHRLSSLSSISSTSFGGGQTITLRRTRPIKINATAKVLYFNKDESAIKKLQGELPLVGNEAPDFEAEDAFDQEFITEEVPLAENETPYLHAEADYHQWSRNKHPTLPSLSRPKLRSLSVSSCTTTTSTISLPFKSSTIPHLASDQSPHLPSPPHRHQDVHLDHPSNSKISSSAPYPQDEFREKVLFLDSIGLDSLTLLTHHPTTIGSASLDDYKSLTSYLFSFGFTSLELRRIINMCPDILSCKLIDIAPVFTFLLREVNVNGSDLRKVINRRPRLLASKVPTRLRPTLYFLQSIGIHEVNKHTALLSCSVEDKFMPRIEYFQRIGFSYRDALLMFRKFPPLFCYSIKGNFEPKFNYFVVEMGRDLKELKKFPQYFSFSLERRIKPRHRTCVDKGVCFPLPVLLKTCEDEFRQRLDLCCSSSLPLKSSPLWCTPPFE